MRRIVQLLGRILLGVLLVLVVAVIGGWLWLRGTTVAQHEGRLTLSGLAAPVLIEREPLGVVHLKAQSQDDAYFALGVVHAQDRLWQMEFQRRTGAGRLSEVVGEATLPTDRFLRTWGFYRAAQSAYQSLSAEGKAVVDAYVRGVNAYLDTNPPLPIEFLLLGFRPEPWTGPDVMVWGKMMSFDLSGNYDTELTRYNLLAKGVSPARLSQLLPPYPEDAATILNAADLAQAVSPAQGQLAQKLLSLSQSLPEPLFRKVGVAEASNNWVVSGAKSATGKPLLANDPHLSYGVPSLWYLAHIEAPNLNVIGATVPGLPVVLLGRNERIAWGATNVGADVQDLYVLQEAAGGYRYKGQVEPYQTLDEAIKVKGQPDQTLKVRLSRYGPVISDVVDAAGQQPLALRWTSLDPQDSLLEAFFLINKAQNWEQFLAAMQRYTTPSQNFVYADVDGNIGYIAPGKFPLRRPGHTGLVPVPGDGNWDWQGYVPFEGWPKVQNPAEGFIVTANNRVVPSSYPYQLSLEWSEPYRAQRIRQMILGKEKLTLDDMAAFQMDTFSLLFRDFRPLLESMTPLTERAEEWKKRLLAWDGNTRATSVEASVFETWYTELSRLPTREVGQAFWDEPRYLLQAVQGSDPGCDRPETEYVENCPEYVAFALERALDRLGERIPPWGQLHKAVFDHPILTNTPLKPVSDRQVSVGGDNYTVNVAGYNGSNFQVSDGPSYRHLIDLAEMQNSRFVHPMGQSGALLAGDFANLLPLWQEGRYLPMKTQGYAVQHRQTLEPQR